mgnify:CR=1 FL=1|tara:strand:- start:4147 stop:4938 length:792 start_codon:yes stop_codon:yes gene_type:complete
MRLTFEIHTSDILQKAKEKVKKQIENDTKLMAKALGDGAIKHAENLANQLPNSLGNIYKESLYIEQESENIITVGIREEALWIEEGRKGGFMSELLKDGKVSKDGSRYRVIPMEKKTSIKSANASSSSGTDLIDDLKGFFRSQGIRYSKDRALSMDENGSPRIGRIHSFSIKDLRDSRNKSAQSLSKNLQGVSVFQNKNSNTGKVERSIMTFRVISDKSKSKGKWNHPGRSPERIIDETFKWVQDTYQRDLLPALRKKYGSKQ